MMAGKGIAVEVENLWKTFQIPHERRTTLFENLAGLIRPNSYETITVLKEVNLEVEKGECIGIIGDNGSGKSTLLKITSNILRPTKGSAKVYGKLTPFLELGVGFQPDLTVRENIRIYGIVMGLPRRTISERIEDVIKFAGLEKFEDTKLKNLSSGMQVRLAFSTAIQTDPDVLLVDEVLAVGDMEFQQKCFDVFNRYRKEGVTILLVSHDLGAVRRFCDRTLLLGGGEQRAFGETGEVLDKYIYGKSRGSRDSAN
jgi:lipopolysaccharide transport system ATP-binding protein